jgi:phage shock protein C
MSNLNASHKDETMTKQTPLPLRNDTILGVCEAIGQDFGFNPIFLRLAFIAPLFFAPYWTFAAYLGLGVLVAATRLIVKVGESQATSVAQPASRPANVEVQEALPIAA